MAKCPSCKHGISYFRLLMGNNEPFSCPNCQTKLRINNDRRLIGMLGSIAVGLFLAYAVYASEFSTFSIALSVAIFLAVVFLFPIFYVVDKSE